MANTPTPHIEAKEGDFAKTVLMPGDPLRAKFIAETYLENVRCVNQVRGMLGFTGTYKGKEISVMGSGMGMPSIGIYSYELFNFYGVDNIIRVGSAGALQDDINLMDVVIGMGASMVSDFGDQFGCPGHLAPLADYNLLSKAVESAKDLGTEVRVGNILSEDAFYNDRPNPKDCFKKMGVLAVEMESGALYLNAARAGKHALCILTISDHIYRPEELTSEERQLGFGKMIEIALETAIRA
ncbi:purine-nucleoside phosphorylase [Roseburia sp. 499]|uniref:purine-nucleoside phosphorylase n=1 Tax=Roseburia sp. 499 TaxID=1261634 RepID=UPI000951DFFF|nr:purine-nucleoside phosphorylase [Roseburia sp. 499]WVK70953.1 purine-nucleoside phosphorylase [Roseburia sp. 499]